jgi:hypothetical protein
MLLAAPLFTETQLFDEFAVSFQVGTLNVLQHPPAFADQDQKSPLAGFVFLELFTVTGQLVDSFSEQRYLNFRGARILLVLAEFGNDGCNAFFG